MSKVQWKNGIPVLPKTPLSSLGPQVQKKLNKLKKKKDKAADDLQRKGEGGSCSHCRKRFDDFTQFLMHVTHSKICLEAHNPDVIKSIKRKSQLRSKRNWYHRNKEWLKEQRSAQQEDGKDSPSNAKSSSYVTVGEKKSFPGRCFYKIFGKMFDDQLEIAKSKLDQLSKQRELSEDLQMEVMDDALDSTFNFEDADFNSMSFDSEDNILDDAFKELELKYKTNFDEECAEKQRIWKDITMYDITDGLFDSKLDRAYRNFFRTSKFKDALGLAENHALDELFFKMIEADDTILEESPCKTEANLERKFEQSWMDEMDNTVKATGVFQNLETFIVKAFEARFSKEGLKF